MSSLLLGPRQSQSNFNDDTPNWDTAGKAARGLAIGVVVAIAVGCLASLCACIFIVFCFVRSRRRRQQRNIAMQQNNAALVGGAGAPPYYQQDNYNNHNSTNTNPEAYTMMTPPPPAQQPYAGHAPTPAVPMSAPAGEAPGKFSPTPAAQPTYGYYP